MWLNHALRQCCDSPNQDAALRWGDLSNLMSRAWRLIHPNTYTCFMCHACWLCLSNERCSMSSPPIFWWTDCPCYKCSLWAGSERQVRLVLLHCCYRFLLVCLPACLPACLCSAAFSVTCPDLHTCLSFVHLCLRMLVRTTVHPQAGTASPSLLSRTCCEPLMSGGAQLLLTVNISMQEKPSQSCVSCVCVCVCVCVSVVSGVCWIWAHCIMDLSVSQEKWIRHWSKACPAC